MLMRGWYPAIPGWHHDDVDRGENGQPDYDGDWLRKDRIMICVALDADDAPTGSLTEWVDEPVNLRWPLPDDEPVYRYWDQQIDQEGFRTHTYPSGTIVLFTQESLHRAVPAAGSGWRWFCRITVNPGPLVDPATVGVMAEVTRDNGPDGLVVLRLPLDAKAPEAFARGGSLAEIRVPSLAQPDARGFALSMLGKGASSDIARRAAAMGGNTPLGVAEAVRVLVASGDVVFAEQKFHWRRGPAGRLSTHTVEALVEERIDQLAPNVRHMLQTLALVPDPEEATVVSEVADSDGLRDSVREDAIEELVSLCLLERGPSGLTAPVNSTIWVGVAPSSVASPARTPSRARLSPTTWPAAGALPRRWRSCSTPRPTRANSDFCARA